MSEKDYMEPKEENINELNMTDEVPQTPNKDDSEVESHSHRTGQTAMEDNPFFLKLIQDVNDAKKEDESFEGLIKINSLINSMVINAQEDSFASYPFIYLGNHMTKIEEETFNWVFDHKNLSIVNKVFELFDLLDRERHFKYINFEEVRELMPIKLFTLYLSKPFSANEEDVVTYGEIIGFQSLVLNVFTKLYIRSFMALQPFIDASEIYSIDPFMRNEYRKMNIDYFINNFWGADNFELYSFIEKLIDDYVLAGLPKWILPQGKPMLIPLLDLVDYLLGYGLISYEFCKPLLRFLYLASETLKSLEIDVSKMDKESLDTNKCRSEFIFCRERISSILIHIFTLFSDTSLEENMMELKSEKPKINFFKSFLFADYASFNYFSSVVIKYLCNYVSIELPIESEIIKSNLTIIFNFIGDFQKDSFVLSMELVNKSYHNFYDELLNNPDQTSEPSLQAIKTCNLVKDFAINIQNNISEYKTTEFENLVHNVYNLIEPFIASPNFKLTLSVNNFANLWLSIIDLQNDVCDLSLIDKALAILMHVLKDNHPSQSVLFRGSGYTHFFSILWKQTFSSLILLRRVFENNSFLLYLSYDMFTVILNVYNQKMNELLNEIDRLEHGIKQIEDIPDINQKIGILFYFNLYFDSILEDHVIKLNRRKRYDIMIATALRPIILRVVMKKLAGIIETEYTELNFINEILDYNIEQRPELIKKLSETESQILIAQFCYLTLKLFNKSTYKIYDGKIYNEITRLPADRLNTNMTFTYPQSILLRLEFVKLFDRFYVFYPNHLITERTFFNGHNILFVGEKFIPDNYNTIKNFILSEFTWFEKFMKHHVEKDDFMLKNIRKYLFKGLLALIYKFLKGIIVHITKLQAPKMINDLKLITDVIIDELEPRMPQFQRLLGYPQKNNPLKGISGLFNKEGKEEQKESNISKKSNKVAVGDPLDVDENDNIEERINPDIKEVRTTINRIIKELTSIYDGTDYDYNIKRCIRENTGHENTEYICKVFTNSQSLRKDFGIVLKNMRNVGNTLIFTNQFRKVKNEYKKVKLSFQENKEENQFLVVLRSIKDAKQNIRNIIEYFLSYFENLNYLKVDDDPKIFYLNNEFFFSSIIILDNLNVWNSNLKKELYLVLKEMNETRRRKILSNLWGTYISLYLLVLFKTFMDKEWEAYWGMFYILSNFIQNLCENNFIEFKEFFNDKILAQGNMKKFTDKNFNQANFSIFFESYILLETSNNFTEFWVTESPQIVPSDRAELFPIFKRLFMQVTEFLTGPCEKNQLTVYRFRIDIWNGIINRLVDDIDSRFYEVKLACLNFISALLEKQNNLIVSFMGSNLQINKLFNVITRLTKKLYVRQTIINNKVSKSDKMKNNLTNILFDAIKAKNKTFSSNIPSLKSESEISLAEENKYRIKNPNELIGMYKRYNDSFSEHIILDVVLTTYVMLINMSFKLKFYEFFLKDKDLDAATYTKKPTSLATEKVEETIIYLFLIHITANIEVKYDRDQTKKLIRLYFRLPSECLFLTEDMRNDFIKNVDCSSIQSKHIDLFDAVDPLHIEMKSNKQFYEKYGDFYIITTSDFFKFNQIVLYLLSLLLNVIMLIFLTSEGAGEEELISKSSSGNKVMNTLGIIIIVYSGLLSILWLIFKYNVEIKSAEAKYLVYHDKIKRKERLKIRLIDCLVLQPRFISFYLHLIFTVLGLSLNNPFFYTLNLFLLTNLLKTVNYILQSIVKHYGKLFVTFILTVLVIFCYSFILMRYYRDQVNDDDYDLNVCKDFLHCFFNSVNLGLRLGGGVSEAFYLVAKPNRGGVFYGRFFFDLTFFILIQLIFLNLIAGIIIDTFSDMRDEMTKRNREIYHVCFICGKTRWQLEKDGVSFKKHIEVDHSLYKYLYYMIRLRTVKSGSFDGIEQYIYEKTSADDSSWIPQNYYLKENVNHMVLPDDDDNNI